MPGRDVALRIAIIWKNDYPWDVRVEKFAKTLSEAGNEVHILASNTGKRPRSECVDNIKIHRLHSSRLSVLNKVISIPFYLNPFWLWMTQRVVVESKIDLLIVRDLPLVPVGIFIKKLHKIPLLLDMAENYPAMYRMRQKKTATGWFANFIFKNPSLMKWVEKLAMRECDHIFVVVQESAQRLLGEYSIPLLSISTVSNTPKLEDFDSYVSLSNGNKISGRRFVIGYVGYIQKGRGLETVIAALHELKKIGIAILFILVGSGDYKEELETLANQYQVSDFVEFAGWLDHSVLPETIARFDAGIIPHNKNEHTDTTIPNKLFDFMASMKAVIVSNTRPMERIVAEERCGVVFEGGNAQDLAKVIMKLSRDRKSCLKMGANGRAAIEAKYNWGRDAVILNNIANQYLKNKEILVGSINLSAEV